MTPDAFWQLPLRVLWLERRVARQQRQDDADRDLILAFQIERIRVLTSNHKRLPDLRAMLRQQRPGAAPRRQTVAQQRAVLELMSSRTGIPLRPRMHVKIRGRS